MKNKLFKGCTSIAAAVAMLLSVPCMPFAEGESTASSAPQPVTTVNFEDMATGDFELTEAWGKLGTPVLKIMTEGTNKYLNIGTSAAGNSGALYKIVGTGRSIDATKKSFTVKYRIRFDQKADIVLGAQVTLGKDAASKGYYTEYYSNWKATAQNYGVQKSASKDSTVGSTKEMKILPNTWHDCTWVYEVEDGATTVPATAKLYFEGSVIKTSVYQRNGAADPESIIFYPYTKDDSGNLSISVDDIQVYEGVVPPTKPAEYDVIDYKFGTSENVYNPNNNNRNVEVSKATLSNKVIDQSVIKTDSVSGKFGKADGDKSVYMNNAAKQTNDRSIQFYTNEHGKLEKAGDSQTISLQYAFDDSLTPVKVHAYGWHGDKSCRMGSDSGNIDFIKLEPSRISVLDDVYDLPFGCQPNQWHNLTFGIKTNAGDDAKATYTVYINGIEICKDKPFEKDILKQDDVFHNTNQFRGFAYIQLLNNYASGKAGAYFDDLKVKSYFSTEPNYADATAISLLNNDENDKWIVGNNTIYAAAGVKPSEIAIPEGVTAVFRDANGTVIEGSTPISGEAYAELTKGSAKKYIRVVAGTTPIAADVNDAAKWAYYRAAAEYETASGLGGKAAGDSSICVKWDGKNSTDAYIDYTIQNRAAASMTKPEAYKPITVSANVYIPELAETEFFRLTPNFVNKTASSGVSANFIGMVGFAGGKIYRYVGLSNGAIAPDLDTPPLDYRAGEWNRVTYTVYPGTNKIDVYVNGEFFYNREAKVNIQLMNVIRFQTNVTNKTVAVDDISVYTGYYTPEVYPSVALTTDAEELGLAMADEKITLSETIASEGFTFANLCEGILTIDGTYKLFNSAGTAKENTEIPADGDVLMLEKKTGDISIYKYYRFVDPSAVAAAPVKFEQSGAEIANGGTYAAGAVTVSSTAESGVMVVAHYYDLAGGARKLKEVKIVDLTQATKSCVIDATINTSIKAMLWNGMNTMKPVEAAFEVTGAAN